MERRTKSFLDELSGPYVPPPEPEVPVVNIRTELGKLIKAGIEILSERPDSQGYHDMLADFYTTIYSRKQVKKYEKRHPEEIKTYGAKSIVIKELRVLRFISYLLSYNELSY